MNNYPTGVTTRDFIDPPPQAQPEASDIDKMIDKYIDDGDLKTHLVELRLAMLDGDPEAENMAICGLKQDIRAFDEKRGYYTPRAR